MSDGALAAELREAVDELQSYLSDQVPPLLVLDSAQLLLRHSPELGAELVRNWVNGQRRAPGAAGAVDYLFHAIKKLELLAKLRLVEPEPWKIYVTHVVEILVAQAPAAERERLRGYLLEASEGEASLAPSVQVLHRAGSATAPAAAAAPAASAEVPAELASEMRRFSMLLSRLNEAQPAAGAEEARRAALGEAAPQLLVAAARSARTQSELEEHLMSLSRAGLMTSARLSELFTTLSQGLPNWWVGDPTGAAPAYESPPVQAMQRIVELAGDPTRTASHFRELLNAVKEQFNAGALPRAVQVLDVARRLMAEGRIDKASADLMLAPAHEELDAAQLMAQTQQPQSLPLLRRLMSFYPALTPQGLLVTLDDEPDRARRRLWIALLEAHGVPARLAALDRLEKSLAETPLIGGHTMWLQRNFVYLLHRIKPAAGEDVTREVKLVVRCAELANPAPLVREALIDLGQRRHPEAEAALAQRLEQIERWLELPGGGGPHDAAELRRMLALVVAGLARQGTRSARRAVATHGLAQRPALGDTLERLGELGAFDLAEDPELVDKLLDALRAQLPVRVLGLSIRRPEGAQDLVRALQSTRSEAVKTVFQDIVRRFPEEPFGQAAAGVLANWSTVPVAEPDTSLADALTPMPVAAPAAAPTASLAGDLEVFGLPELLQTLQQTEASGRLLLRTRAGKTMGEIQLDRGLVRDAKVRNLTMPDAFYQIMEATEPGTFEFTRQPPAAQAGGRDIMGLLMEGMRRYDELQRARALAPDHALLRPTGTRPTPPPEETDGAFIRELWTRLRESATPRQCEEAVAADAYRIRVLLTHWLAEGALQIHEAPELLPP
jgi:hypothetical protein